MSSIKIGTTAYISCAEDTNEIRVRESRKDSTLGLESLLAGVIYVAMHLDGDVRSSRVSSAQ
jgi:hypothetical protein